MCIWNNQYFWEIFNSFEVSSLLVCNDGDGPRLYNPWEGGGDISLGSNPISVQFRVRIFSSPPVFWGVGMGETAHCGLHRHERDPHRKILLICLCKGAREAQTFHTRKECACVLRTKCMATARLRKCLLPDSSWKSYAEHSVTAAEITLPSLHPLSSNILSNMISDGQLKCFFHFFQR